MDMDMPGVWLRAWGGRIGALANKLQAVPELAGGIYLNTADQRLNCKREREGAAQSL
jgi:hypothetical protein